MARDLKIQNTTLDPNLYTYRQARDVSKTQVDWATLTKTLSDDLSKIRDEREKTRQETIDSQRELLKEIENTDKLSHETANTLIQGAAYDASQVLNTDFQLLTSGQIKLKDYKKTEQRVRDNFTSLKNVMDGFEAHFVESQKRVDEGLANPDEIAANMSLSGFGSMQNIDIVWQPNGTMTLVRKRYDAEGNELPVDPSNPANVIPIGSMKGYLNHKSTYVDPNDSAQGIVDTLGSFITSEFLSQQKVTSLEDFRNLSYEGRTNKDLINSMITELITTDQQKISMLRAKGYTEDDFTFDPKEAEEEGKILMINNAGGSGRMGYKFTEQAEADMRDLGRQIIERQLDSKITNVKGFQAPTRPPTPVEAATDIQEQNAGLLYEYINGIATAGSATAESNARSLEALVNKNVTNASDKIQKITRTVESDGTVNITIDKRGMAPYEISSKASDGTFKSVADFENEIYDYLNFTTKTGKDAAKEFGGVIPEEFSTDLSGFTARAPVGEITAPLMNDPIGKKGSLSDPKLYADALHGGSGEDKIWVKDNEDKVPGNFKRKLENLIKGVLETPGNEALNDAVGDIKVIWDPDNTAGDEVLIIRLYGNDGGQIGNGFGWQSEMKGTYRSEEMISAVYNAIDNAVEELNEKVVAGDNIFD